ncbi:hypothetical protein DY000_02048756 [Brassica cretica]|uniref:Uncharacterized protein n=1 Tax=Brassica cretica TaxID=69181 RepID=A0ABQ7EXF0_BRACR|nr:hypothetical protein DY000_02048756 [Brassica cretica]
MLRANVWFAAVTMNSTLTRHKSKPRVYIGCMKSGPVLAQKGVEYHEPEYWKFSVYFKKLLHKYANEDIS